MNKVDFILWAVLIGLVVTVMIVTQAPIHMILIVIGIILFVAWIAYGFDQALRY